MLWRKEPQPEPGPGCSLSVALARLIPAVSSAPPSCTPLPSSLACWCWPPHPLLASTACVCYCSPGAEPGLAGSQTCGYSMYSECSAKFVIIRDYFFFSNLEGVGWKQGFVRCWRRGCTEFRVVSVRKALQACLPYPFCVFPFAFLSLSLPYQMKSGCRRPARQALVCSD